MAGPKARKKRKPATRPAGDLPAAQPGVAFPIVAIGASAGGIEALTRLVKALPRAPGMAFVVLQHLSPSHASSLPEILARATRMPVRTAGQDLALEPDHVYVIPPGKDLTYAAGTLRLSAPEEPRVHHRPIDKFMRSLAEEHGHKAIGVVMSGSNNDGTHGLGEIKAAGGITFAQDATAEHDTMPRSAIATGSVDLVLSPEAIGRELGRIGRHPYVTDDAPPRPEPAIGRLLDLLRQHSGVDFTNYKRNTLHRRITRRIVLHRIDGLPEYLSYVKANPAELDALYHDILISVTSFFRNPEAFETLKQHVFPRLAGANPRPEPLRAWVLGCSTGEEAYSIAMAFAEYADEHSRRATLHVFATDLNGAVIERARAGVYPKSIAQDVSPERLRRFFVEVDGHYRVAKPIRDMCVFARQNALSDPPFSRMDLIACRNMLIYLEPVLQQKLMPVLHFALRPGGFLWLGSSETIGTFRDLFELEDAKSKLYAKKNTGRRRLELPIAALPPSLPHHDLAPVRVATAVDPQREADRMLLARYAPASVLLDNALEIVQFRGDTSPYLTPAPGRASLNLMKMLRDGLLVGVRGAVHRAQREQEPVRELGLRVRSDAGRPREVDVTVLPVKGSGVPGGTLLVLFEEPGQSDRAAESPVARVPAAPGEIERLRHELASTRDYLQSVIEQQEGANEELQSANEEVQSANEELQSINEELETSKEEIQSSNEELATVNEELQTRNQQLSTSNDDLTNLLASVQMPIVMLGRDLRIRRFTPAAEQLFSLVPADVGRSIGDVKLRLNLPELGPLLAEAIDTVSVRELDVQDPAGRWHLLRVRPYQSLDNRIDGALLMLIDIDSLKRAEQALRETIRSKNDFLAMLAHELRNPLAALQNASELLEAGAHDSGTLAETRAVAARQVQNMKRLVDGLLAIARFDRGEGDLRLETVDLAQVVQRAAAASAAQRGQASQRLSLALPKDGTLTLRGDATRLEQVVGNLLNNASRYTPAGGEIWVSLERTGGAAPTAVLKVRDNGAGIPAAAMNRIFDFSTQVDPSLERETGGLGIGLALARQLVELHEGELSAVSGGKDRGSEFIVTLPLTDWQPETTGPDPGGKSVRKRRRA